jgi:hypothetical protein
MQLTEPQGNYSVASSFTQSQLQNAIYSNADKTVLASYGVEANMPLTNTMEAGHNLTTTFGATTGTTSSGTVFEIPAFTSSGTPTPINRVQAGHGKRDVYTDENIENAMGNNFTQYINYVGMLREEAEAKDVQAELDASAAATQNIVDQATARTQAYVDQETLSPTETATTFADLANYQGTAGGSRPDAGTGAFYDRTADEQTATIDAYRGDPATDFDPRFIPGTVAGQIQIRNDITGTLDSLTTTSVEMALTVMQGLGIDTSTLVPEVVEVEGRRYTTFKTPEGQDVSSLISNLGATIQDQIAGVSGETISGLGYGETIDGVPQPTLFEDISGLRSDVQAIDLGDISTLTQDDISSALSSQFGDLSADIAGVSTQVQDVQTVVDVVDQAVGDLTQGEADIVASLADLNLDTDQIIQAIGNVRGDIDLVRGEAAGYAQATARGLAQQGGTLGDLQTGQSALMADTAGASALQQVAGTLEDVQTGQGTIQTELGQVATAEQQEAVAQTVEDIKTSTSDIDTVIRQNVIPEFDGILNAFDENGNLLSEFSNSLGETIRTTANENGQIILDNISNQSQQVLDLAGRVDENGNLLRSQETGLNFIEEEVIASRDALYNKIGTAFTDTGELIEQGIATNGDEIQRVIDGQGVLTETIVDDLGIVQETIVTDLGTLADETGLISQTALQIASQTVELDEFEGLFDAQGQLITSGMDRFGREVEREFDQTNQFINEDYYQNGVLVEQKQLRLEDILSKLFPTDPLEQPEELTAADRRFMQGLRTQGLMSV